MKTSNNTVLNHFKNLDIDGFMVEINQDGTVIKVNGQQIKSYLNKKSQTKNKHKSGQYYYCYVNKKRYLVHRLVAIAWIPNEDNYPFAVHLDTQTTNNYYKNLAWGNQKLIGQNMIVAQRTAKTAKSARVNSKIKMEDIPVIVTRIKNNESLKSIAIDYQVSDMAIHRIKVNPLYAAK
jgi:hypothetical protein